MTLGDRVAVLQKGVLRQAASPRELYERPANLFVAGFIGSPAMNFLPARIDGRSLALPIATIELAPERAARIGGRELLLAGIRPDAIEDAERVPSPRRAAGVELEVAVDVTEWLGSELLAYVPFDAPPGAAEELRRLARDLDSESFRTQIVASLDGGSRIRAGDRAKLWLDPGDIHLFDPETGERLG
jgi:multiple sugar transport system ATP-binding protein